MVRFLACLIFLRNQGTYQFLAARFVNDVDHLTLTPHSRLDDVESMFHVLQWVVLRYVKHGMSPEVKLGNTLYDTFDEAKWEGDGKIICVGRQQCIDRSILKSCVNLNGVLKDVLEDIRNAFFARYIPVDKMKEAQESYETLQEFSKVSGISRRLLMSTERHAMPAIRLEKLNQPTWFADLLRNAANNPQCPIDDESAPQKYIPFAPESWTGTNTFLPCVPKDERPTKRRKIGMNEQEG